MFFGNWGVGVTDCIRAICNLRVLHVSVVGNVVGGVSGVGACG